MLVREIKHFELLDSRENPYKLQQTLLTKEDNTIIKSDYILSTKACLTKSEKDLVLKEEMLDLVNSIYKDNNKLKVLGLGYPVLIIGTTHNNKLTCTLYDFKSSTGKDNFTCPNYITNVSIADDKIIELNEIEFKHKILVTTFSDTINLKIKGIENISELNDRNITLIDRVVRNHYNGELRLKYLDNINFMKTTGYAGIKKLKLENTCTISNIPEQLLDKFLGLEEIVLSDSVQTICGSALKRFVLKQNNDWVINMFRANGAQRIKINHKEFM